MATNDALLAAVPCCLPSPASMSRYRQSDHGRPSVIGHRSSAATGGGRRTWFRDAGDSQTRAHRGTGRPESAHHPRLTELVSRETLHEKYRPSFAEAASVPCSGAAAFPRARVGPLTDAPPNAVAKARWLRGQYVTALASGYSCCFSRRLKANCHRHHRQPFRGVQSNHAWVGPEQPIFLGLLHEWRRTRGSTYDMNLCRCAHQCSLPPYRRWGAVIPGRSTG
jgi:hypothetical protein